MYDGSNRKHEKGSRRGGGFRRRQDSCRGQGSRSRCRTRFPVESRGRSFWSASSVLVRPLVWSGPYVEEIPGPVGAGREGRPSTTNAKLMTQEEKKLNDSTG